MSEKERPPLELTPEEEATSLVNEAMDLWSKLPESVAFDSEENFRDATIQLNSEQRLYISQSRETGDAENIRNVVQLNIEPTYRAPRRPLAYWDSNGSELRDPSAINELEADEIKRLLLDAIEVLQLKNDSHSPDLPDAKLVEGFSHEPEIVRLARWIEDSSYELDREPDYHDLLEYVDIFYGVTEHQTERALGIAQARVRRELRYGEA